MSTNSPAMEGKARSFWEGFFSVFIPPPEPTIRHKSSDEIVVEVSGKLYVVNLDDQSYRNTDAVSLSEDWENVMKGLSRAVSIDPSAFDFSRTTNHEDGSQVVPTAPKTVTPPYRR